MHITKLVYAGMPTDENYSVLNATGTLVITDYNTIEITRDSVDYATTLIIMNEYDSISLEDYLFILKETIGSDVYAALMNSEIDLVMLVKE